SQAVPPHEPDHLIALKHGGQTTFENLALACFVCNRFKGSDIASIDAVTGELVGLFNPAHNDGSNTFGWTALTSSH
ncbi:MAG TPA: HNH endonuclease signature motif containing protein, partial [Pyrinomonadaceae bacterium]